MAYAIALIHEADGAFSVTFPDFPGCTGAGASLDDAIENGGRALALQIAGMMEKGAPLPRLRSARELRFDPDVAPLLDKAIIATVALP